MRPFFKTLYAPVSIDDDSEPSGDANSEPKSPPKDASSVSSKARSVLWFGTIASALPLVYSVYLASHNIVRLASIQKVMEGDYFDRTNRTFGYASNSGVKADRPYLKDDMAPMPPMDDSLVLPLTIDVVNSLHGDGVYKAKRNVQISQYTSVVLQFEMLPPKKIDTTGVCQISGIFPAQDDMPKKKLIISEPILEVWQSKGASEGQVIDTAPSSSATTNMTFNSTPKRHTYLGSITPLQGKHVYSSGFACPNVGERLFVEVACQSKSSRCLLSTDQDNKAPFVGFAMMVL